MILFVVFTFALSAFPTRHLCCWRDSHREFLCLPHANIDQPRLVSTSTIRLPTFLDLIPNSISASHKSEPCAISSLRLTSLRTPSITNFGFFLIRRERKGKNDPLSHDPCWLGPPYHASGLPGAAVRCVKIQLLQVPTGLWHCHATTQALGWSPCAFTCRHTSKALTWIDTTSSSNADKLITDSRGGEMTKKTPKSQWQPTIQLTPTQVSELNL